MSELNVFDPVLLSIQECKFLLDNLGKPTIVALQDIPKGVNPKAVKEVLDRVNELEQLKAHSGQEWAGVDVMKEKIEDYLRENAKWKADNKRYRKAPRFPSLFSYDSKGRSHRGGIGSDSGYVRTFFGPDGTRIPFAVPLFDEMVGDWTPPGFTEKPTSSGLKVDDANNRLECTICGHTESFKGESRASYSAARARMSKHLRKATDKVDEHKELHQSEFS